jgi:hypothetical protein
LYTNSSVVAVPRVETFHTDVGVLNPQAFPVEEQHPDLVGHERTKLSFEGGELCFQGFDDRVVIQFVQIPFYVLHRSNLL